MTDFEVAVPLLAATDGDPVLNQRDANGWVVLEECCPHDAGWHRSRNGA